jgi:hypothetical protein
MTNIKRWGKLKTILHRLEWTNGMASGTHADSVSIRGTGSEVRRTRSIDSQLIFHSGYDLDESQEGAASH